MLEQHLQKQILDYLRWKGIVCWKNNTASSYVKSRNIYIKSYAVGVSTFLEFRLAVVSWQWK
jgi:hypothetical protein